MTEVKEGGLLPRVTYILASDKPRPNWSNFLGNDFEDYESIPDIELPAPLCWLYVEYCRCVLDGHDIIQNLTDAMRFGCALPEEGIAEAKSRIAQHQQTAQILHIVLMALVESLPGVVGKDLPLTWLAPLRVLPGWRVGQKVLSTE